jgi:hypothetical protein
MAGISGNSTLTRSQIEGIETAHLAAAATSWAATAEQWEEHFTTIHKGTLSPGGTPWEGTGADAAQDGTFADLVKVRGMADHLHTAATAARNGADDIAWAKRQTLDVIAQAQEAGFTVGEDLSVTDRSSLLPAGAQAARQAQAEAFAAEIRAAAENLAAVDKTVAAQVSTALAPLEGTDFGDSPGDPTVQAVDYKAAPPPPSDPDDQPKPKEPHATDPNRSADGTYGPGNSGDGKAAEKAALDDREARTHIPIIRDQVKATHPDVIDPITKKPQGRLYDGLEPTGNPDEYIGIEAKTHPGAHQTRQDRFDAAVSPERPATAILNGREIKIVDVQPAYPPDGWVPPSQRTPAPGGAFGGAEAQGTAPVGAGLAGAPVHGSAPVTSAFPDWGSHQSPQEMLGSDDPVTRVLGELLLEQQHAQGIVDPNGTA